MKKLLNKKGFTLMEMLIVVAIIVILVAVSVPTFTSQLDKANQATDLANERSAKGLANTMAMLDEVEYPANTTTATYYYDAANGKLVNSDANIDGYGMSSSLADDSIATGNGVPKDGIVKVTFTETNGTTTMTYEWVTVSE